MTTGPRIETRMQRLVAQVIEIHKITLDPAKRTKTGSMPHVHVEEIQALCRRILNGGEHR